MLSGPRSSSLLFGCWENGGRLVKMKLNSELPTVFGVGNENLALILLAWWSGCSSNGRLGWQISYFCAWKFVTHLSSAAFFHI